MLGAWQRFPSHDQINNLFHLRRDHLTAAEHRAFQGPNIPGLDGNLQHGLPIDLQCPLPIVYIWLTTLAS
jgi:hypothetical protein